MCKLPIVVSWYFIKIKQKSKGMGQVIYLSRIANTIWQRTPVNPDPPQKKIEKRKGKGEQNENENKSILVYSGVTNWE